ncbi:Aldo-ket-red domain-containing protein [Aphelenchoides besseyi]|nr:Aldo-ket-red domain-containing protein [Aphelenchoides besseyi]
MSTKGGPRVKLNSGHEIPLVGFGTYKITGQETIDKAVNAALEAGYRHFDTAKYYKNEPELGNAFEKLLPKYNLKREDIYITTKLWPAAEGNSEKIPEQVQESLKNLKTDYLDLVLIHYPKSDERENEDEKNAENRRDCWLALEKEHQKGIIRSIGVSNYEVRHMEELPAYQTIVPAVNQVEYHPHFQRRDIKEYCKKHGIFFQAYSSLGRQEPALVNDSVIVEIAKKYNTTVEVCIALHLKQPHINFQQILLAFATNQSIGIVPKSTTPERIRNNWKVLEVTLNEEDLKRLNSIDKDQHYIRCTPWLVK